MATALEVHPQSNHSGSVKSKKLRWAQWLALVLAMSGAVVWLDIVTSPFIFFPILFVAPVGCAAWFLSRTAGMGIAVAVVAARFWVAETYEGKFIPASDALLNAGIRLVVFLGVAYLLSKIRQQKHELERRVEELEGILPICAFCKKIRNDDGEWEQLERYVTERSAAEFSHSVCTECEHLHYGETAGHHQEMIRK